MNTRTTPPSPAPSRSWSVDSWRGLPGERPVEYADHAALERAVEHLRSAPPLVTSGEIERLRRRLARAQAGEEFLLQAGDCAERFEDCRAGVIAGKVKLLLSLAGALESALGIPVIGAARLAGQYAKPRSSPTQRVGEGGAARTLPSYFGDLFNSVEPTAEARRPDPALLVRGYEHAALTLNFVRALLAGGLADRVRWEGGEEAGPRIARRAEIFTSHEGLSLDYESAQTRPVPRRRGLYDLSCHLPWIGHRSRLHGPAGAHGEFFRGVANPVGLKIGPPVDADALLRWADALDPAGTPGRLVLITRLGAARVEEVLPPLVRALRGRPALWVCDPMHGNTVHALGRKTRRLSEIQRELALTIGVLRAEGAHLGGVHLELTDADVTECVDGSRVREDDLNRNYTSLCDPRLGGGQAKELIAHLAGLLKGG